MNIKDYANDVNLSVAEILKKCEELGIKANANSELTDDDIIILDNTLNLISTDKETTFDDEDANEIGDKTRPFSVETWERAYELWNRESFEGFQ